MKYPCIGTVIRFSDEFFLFVTSLNFQKDIGTFRFFPSYEAADKWGHDISLKQLPDWHSKNCPHCKKVSNETTKS